MEFCVGEGRSAVILHVLLMIAFGEFLGDDLFGRSGQVKANLSAWTYETIVECSQLGHRFDKMK